MPRSAYALETRLALNLPPPATLRLVSLRFRCSGCGSLTFPGERKSYKCLENLTNKIKLERLEHVLLLYVERLNFSFETMFPKKKNLIKKPNR